MKINQLLEKYEPSKPSVENHVEICQNVTRIGFGALSLYNRRVGRQSHDDMHFLRKRRWTKKVQRWINRESIIPD